MLIWTDLLTEHVYQMRGNVSSLEHNPPYHSDMWTHTDTHTVEWSIFKPQSPTLPGPARPRVAGPQQSFYFQPWML